MKSITEFPSYVLNPALKTKAALVAEGKSPEEVETSLGTTYKLEGDKLKHFITSLDLAEKNADGLKRIVIMSLNEGETAPPKSVKVEEVYYVPQFHVVAAPAKAADGKGGKGGGRGGQGGRGKPGQGGGKGEKESPWGLSPEQKAAKKGKGAQVAAAAAKK